MKLRIQGARDEFQRSHIKQMVLFCAASLLSEKQRSKLRINVCVGQTEEMGWCEVLDYTSKKPRSFRIRLSSEQRRLKGLLSTVAHEMVHVSQYATGRMKVKGKNANITQFEGKRYKDEDETDVTYWFSPWEIEAHGLERGLLVLYCKQFGLEMLLSSYD